MTYKVIDKTTGNYADLDKIKDENWIINSDLMAMDLNDFALMQDGSLILTDDCGNFIFVGDRFYPIFVLR